MNATRRFLERLAGNKDDAALLVLFTLPDRRTRWFTDLDRAADAAVQMAATHNVYVGIGLHDRALGGRARGTEMDVSALTALVADIDVAHALHQHTNLPPTLADARALLGEMPLDPSMVVDSGHGLQALWTFREPYVYDDDDDRERSTAIAAGWGERLRAAAKAHDWHVDSVFDPSRVMRIPGTFNRKDETDVRPVTLLSWDGPTYGGPDDFVDHVTPVSRAQRGKAPAGEGGEAPTFTLNPDAEAPTKKVTDLLRSNSKFKGAYDRTRSDVEDKSQSGWDFAMAWQTLPAGWSHQETVDLLVAHRREGGSERDALNKGVGYYQRTINNVKWGVVKGLTEKAALRAAAAEALLALSPEQTREALKKALGVGITEVIKRFPQADTASYSVRIEGIDEPVFVGDVRAFCDQKRFAEALYQRASRTPIRLGPDKWDNALLLLLAITVVDDTPAVSRLGELEEWVARYIEEVVGREETDTTTTSPDGAAIAHQPYIDAGWFYLQTDTFTQFIQSKHGTVPDGLRVRLREAGFEAVRLKPWDATAKVQRDRWYWRRAYPQEE